ncbi:Ni/Fe hydrogenase subunit alpha [Mycobacterium heckeshornense]|uniref:Ni/Fe hydrogenase subunit alpha n=1 Tax=Mycobacterium heckeshornense TaxID=110505 RepID=A0A2G8B630_9MYCO|nr:Ni/Fe hydrogenase subunit alpha [Mycobacterium heckeshornense]KMV15446.1 dehydrogenase [Mycobacterium heckeshornense]MCV7034924.1 Ni/Fe hydrogenase subunit alpha [Mycobacterium heckeshornense]PIJ33223.1 Ni/Fe hydrogenase subunit alpha [Mycobacterium heckeshornense]BCO34956.1 Ni/Fe hydrogenase subunit alpha [Mycobacterium heckeshornense]BCQ08125.1 NAD-reducing hydrogenase HoxS subunit beta [Mycobacterium heckeshornense]
MSPETRNLDVGALTRVEGEGALRVTLTNGAVESAQLKIYEPPRFFEAFLRGRSYTEPPDITARICGICPVAYQVSACNAIEDACGVMIDPELIALRRLLYCGEWIHSHVLHIYLLHAPDFLGYPDAISLAKDRREFVERGLALKKAGNRLMEQLGGRAIHPINVRLGGFYSVPSRDELQPLAEMLRNAMDDALYTVRAVADFDFPDHELDYELLALTDPNRYAIENGVVNRSAGPAFGAVEFSDHVVESQVPHSTALHATLDGRRYLTGPLARYSLNSAALSPIARQAATEARLGSECRNPFRSIIVRAVEVVYAIEEALRLITDYHQPSRPFVEVPARPGIGHGVSEAPRGLLYHRYEIDADGLIRAVTIVPPTSQNQAAIEHDIAQLVAANATLDDETLTSLCERGIRNYDPCISCSAHFLTLTVERH